MQAQQYQSTQQEMLRQRLPFIILGMVMLGGILLLRVISFQFPQDPRVIREFAAQRDANAGRIETFEAPRGNIYDRNGNPLAVNTRRYRVGISPNIISNPARTAAELAAILNRDELEIYNIVTSDQPWEPLAAELDAETWQQVNGLDLFAITVDRIHRRLYPQGVLGAQVIGFVGGTGEDARGYVGIESYYQQQLAGRIRDQEVSNIPFDVPQDPSSTLGQGADLVLTLDRDIQFLIESELQLAVNATESTSGTIIVMNPRNGDILGMASYPTFDPNAYFDVPDERLLMNPAISQAYEPGSVFKVLTVAAALDNGTITPDWTYNDNGQLDIGGIRIQNWDDKAHGLVDVTQVLVQSLNVGAATIALEMGWEDFYDMIDRFGIGKLTRIDLEGEEDGILRAPDGVIEDWSESDLGTNSYGQGVSVTPLQMLTAINAIANDGLMMQPRVVYQIVDGETIIPSRPSALGRPVSEETARIVTEMMVAAVQEGLDEGAQLPGYTIAGKTGTSEIPGVVGYLSDSWIMTFVGFFPADDPQISVLVKLDRPRSGRWASQVAAPVFQRLASRLVVLMEIPNDDVRHALSAEGVVIGEEPEIESGTN